MRGCLRWIIYEYFITRVDPRLWNGVGFFGGWILFQWGIGLHVIISRSPVHCRNGCRSCGVFCSMMNIIDRLRLDKEVDIFLTIRELQAIRPQFVQTYVSFLWTLTCPSPHSTRAHVYFYEENHTAVLGIICLVKCKRLALTADECLCHF